MDHKLKCDQNNFIVKLNKHFYCVHSESRQEIARVRESSGRVQGGGGGEREKKIKADHILTQITSAM